MIHRNAILRYFGALVVVMAAQVAVLPSAMAYEQTRTEVGVRLRLTSLPVRVRLDTPVPGLLDGGRAAILRAISSWNSRACSSPLFVLTDEDDDVSIEVIPVGDGWKYGSAIAAHTTVDSDPYQGEIRHVVIEIDTRRKWSEDASVSSDALDLESVLLHELGHALGLDHSRNSEAVMRAGIKPGQTRRSLHEDDLSGACDILKHSQLEGSGSIGDILRMAKRTTWPLAALLLVLVGLVVVFAALVKRAFARLFPQGIRRSSLCRIGNPFP